jgi:predicted DsbA family dithiol-disulfide isomerase
MQVEIWSDIVCPWCYLGKRRFERALASFAHHDGVEVVYRSFELDPSAVPGQTVPTVDLLTGKYGMTAEQAQDAQQQMAQRAAADGLIFRTDGQRSGNTRDAHRLLHLARARGRQADLVERLHSAHFSEQRSVFDHDSLVEIAAESGLNRDEARAVLADDAYSGDVDVDVSTARELGANGVPYFVIDRRYGISGAQPAETIARALDRAWAESHAS